MNSQRRRGQDITLWPVKVTTDKRGNRARSADHSKPIRTKGWVTPQRSARAELPGQQVINVIRIGIASEVGDIELWSEVLYAGKTYDVVAPPAYHHGSRHVRHWALDLRERPSG